MWKLALVGPLPARGLALAGGCVECTRGGSAPAECHGFGSGCLGYSALEPSHATTGGDDALPVFRFAPPLVLPND
jgi:hypothetical protein